MRFVLHVLLGAGGLQAVHCGAVQTTQNWVAKPDRPAISHWAMRQLRPDLYAVYGTVGVVHLLVEPEGLTLVDTGFMGDLGRIQRAITSLGRKPSDLKAILLTHGHLDHTANAAALQTWSGARVYAPVGDELLVAGRYSYHGAARVCGGLEAGGRFLLRYRPPHVDVWFKDGDWLPVWGGLRAVALPGHTPGHSGFYSEAKRVFFVGNVFAHMWRLSLPPVVFNTNSAQEQESFIKIAGFDMDLCVPGHYFHIDKSLTDRVRKKAVRLRP